MSSVHSQNWKFFFKTPAICGKLDQRNMVGAMQCEPAVVNAHEMTQCNTTAPKDRLLFHDLLLISRVYKRRESIKLRYVS